MSQKEGDIQIEYLYGMRVLILIVVILFTFNPKTSATHVMGGEVYYECLDPATNKYRFTVKLYRDCYNGVPFFDDPIFVSIYDINDNLVIQFNMSLPPNDTLDNETYNVCLYSPPDICVHTAVYQGDFFLPPGEFYMTYQRCCRNATIQNIQNPSATGFAFDIKIPDSTEAACNSSPYFNNYPPTIICLDEQFTYDHSATDPDGDSLVYYLCAPNQYNTASPPAGLGIIPDPSGPPSSNYNVTYAVPYDSAYPIWAPVDSFAIDPVTGWMTGTPEIPGNYVVAVCVSEYRNGILLSTNKRDFQFTVAQCLSDPQTAFISQPDPCDNLKINFTYTGNAVESFFWDFGVGTSISDTSIFQNPSYTFPDTGTYAVKLVVNQNYSCADTLTINVTPPNPLTADLSVDSCTGDTVFFQDKSNTNVYAGSITSWIWIYGDGSNNDFIQNPSHVYSSAGTYIVTLIITTTNNCVDTVVISITTSPCGITGQKELDGRDNDISIYPNPSTGLFTILYSSLISQRNIALKIYSIEGKLVHSKDLVSANNKISHLVDLADMKRGIYFLKLVTDGEVVTKKIIVQ